MRILTDERRVARTTVALAVICGALALALAGVTALWLHLWQSGAPRYPSAAETAVQLTQLRERIGLPNDPAQPWAATWHARLNYAQGRLDALAGSWSAAAYGEVQRWLGDVAADLRGRERGRLPHFPKDESFLCGFWSTMDDTVQPYWVCLPKDYDPKRRYPLLVTLHGQGMFATYQGSAYQSLDKIVIAPHGRGGMDYMWVAEPDILAAVESAKRQFLVDETRIFCAGHSMGGTGAWHLATRFPDLFAAIVPGCGNTDTRVWADIWNWHTPADSPLAWARDFLRDDTGAVIYAENLRNVHVVALQGEADPVVNVRHGENMAAALRAAGHPSFRYCPLPFVTHGFGVDTDRALGSFTRVEKPERVVFRTAWLRYDGAAWVRINGLARRLHLAKIDARAVPGSGEIRAQTENVTAVSFAPEKSPLGKDVRRVIIDEHEVPYQATEPCAFFKDAAGQWRQGTPPAATAFPPAKTREVEGPLEHVFMSRFLLVKPTAHTPTAAVARRACDEYAAMWKQRFGQLPRIRDDHDVTETDLAESSLVLFGGPRDNLWTGRVVGRLPVAFEADGRIRLGNETYSGANLGIKLCYPNPFNPRRYVALIAGTTAASYVDINARFGNWFDWIPYDYRNHFDYAIFDDQTVGRAPETFLVWGFFGEDWSVEKGERFPAVPAWRASVRPRQLPHIGAATLAAGPVFLDGVATDVARFDKEYLERNRNLDGHELRLAGEVMPRGLAFRWPGSVRFVNPGFTRLTATVGIEWDGHSPRCDDCRKSERAVFSVYGSGGKLLWRSTEGMKHDDASVTIDVDITGEKKVTLDVGGGCTWLNGTTVWADARFE